jgi:inner membrane protein
MPTPLGHALGGLIVALGMGGQSGSGKGTGSTRGVPDRVFLGACATSACLPDLDFLWGRHNMETHSLGFALLAGLLALAVDRLGWLRRWQPVRASDRSPSLNWRLAVGCTLAVISHVLFDWLGSDDFPPLGVMALWPLSREFYFADLFVFDAISRRYWLPGFVAHNVLAVLREIVILLPVLLPLWWWRRRPT